MCPDDKDDKGILRGPVRVFLRFPRSFEISQDSLESSGFLIFVRILARVWTEKCAQKTSIIKVF